MNKYSAVSDIELNHAVAVACGYKVMNCDESVMAYIDSGYKPFDPAGNPADAMPIVEKHGIGLMCLDNGRWLASSELRQAIVHGSAYAKLSVDDSPYRAAMEIFLMMKDDEASGNRDPMLPPLSAFHCYLKVVNRLKRAGIETTEQLIEKSEVDLLKMPGIGTGLLRLINDDLKRFGLKLSDRYASGK